MSKLVKPTEYAQSQGISRQAVYAKIKKGILTSKTVDGKIYIVMDKEFHHTFEEQLLNEKDIEDTASHLIDVKELLHSKEQTIAILKESISDLKQTNTEINTTLRGEIELLKQVFTEMRSLYVKQVDYMSSEKNLELEARYTKDEIASIETKVAEEEDECWITLEEFFDRSDIKKEKKRLKIEKRLKKAFKKGDSRIKREHGRIYLSCYHFYEDILKK
jgi:predicted DNA-binding protein YlxM (UPF0122 family)